MPDWAALLPATPTPTLVHAETFVKKFGTASAPVLLECDNGDYVVKSRNAGRMIVTDQMVGRVGVAMSAPCPNVALVEITQSFIDAEPQMAHMAAGIAHGSRWIPNCSEQKSFEHTSVSENRDRFARLALLFGLALASDHQFIYEDTDPHLVWSMDHGHFFAGSIEWTSETLRNAPAAEADGTIVGKCTLTDAEIAVAKAGMTRLSDPDIAAAVMAPRDDWGISQDERVAVANYLATRRDVMFGPLRDEEGAA